MGLGGLGFGGFAVELFFDMVVLVEAGVPFSFRFGLVLIFRTLS
jgi:hypothetical protein